MADDSPQYKLLTAMIIVITSPLVITLTSKTSTEDAVVPQRSHPTVPCNLHPLSGWTDGNTRFYGISDQNLWLYDSTMGVWDHVSLPNKTREESSSWRVRCEHEHYLVVDNLDEAFVLQMSSSQWHQVPISNISSSHLTWCLGGHFIAMDLYTGSVYRLNFKKARWETDQGIANFYYNETESDVIGLSWSENHAQVLYLWLKDLSSDAQSLWTANYSTTNISFIQVDEWEYENITVHLESLVTWITDRVLWVWGRGQEEEEIWKLDPESSHWEQVPIKYEDSQDNRFPSLNRTVTAWTENGKLCVLSTQAECKNNLFDGEIWCLHTSGLESTNFPTTVSQDSVALPTQITSSDEYLSSNDSHSRGTQVVTPLLSTVPLSNPTPTNTEAPSTPYYSKESYVSWHPGLQRTRNVSNIEVLYREETFKPKMDVSTATRSSWHQQHSTVFGSVVFFGTSLTIFGVVGIVWCVRRCVHFPKDALLLRDPPSVRYTAIPDAQA
ncbi:uncharacterized protein LOC111088072 [Limulus polyphemus]|uniref:Uncharacterized protein LOC111088072 n=1 Tax=Limulus polyphemus TaxID=6850 RepID=A0ABM1T9V5_LIMPO|nr:uncharacterized protein LOC111088072 [Limulus polyphemus]